MGIPVFDVSMISVVLSLLSFLSLSSAAAPNYRGHFCSNDTTFTPNSTYQFNLNHLLSSLSSNGTRESGFYNTTAGGQNPIYGLFLCRGDLTTDACRDCVASAATEIVQLYCRVGKVAVIWYDECTLRYSNRSFFSTMEEKPNLFLWNVRDVAEQPVRFRRLVNTTLNDLVPLAANAPSGAKMFAVKEVPFTGLQTLYSLVQCTPDISSSECNRCLRGAMTNLPNCCDGKEGGRVLYPSCNLRYETYKFYLTQSVAAPAPAPTSIPTPVLLPLPAPGKNEISTLKIVAIVASIAVSLVLLAVGYYFLSRRARKKKYNAAPDENESEITTIESLQLDFATIEAATNKFSDDNKLGVGGYGEVYKGIFPNRQEIAVKRLSGSSEQGAEEFKNEIVLVAKLQHRNLVRLLGFCLEGEEKMLVYEFVPNKSLDYFLFDPDKKRVLNWSTRYKIIKGIARGILYLHEDSRFKVIHRDLKAGNILLDEDMNPKISDFGIARIFGVDQTQGNTRRIFGTYGYMAPEYAMQGQFSAKSDVYSFGVLILEILSGKSNGSFYQSDTAVDLLTYAWNHWRNGTFSELLDPTLGDSYTTNDEVTQCIHMGVLCVQENPADRPTMASIVSVLDSYSVPLPPPEKPEIFLQSRTDQSNPVPLSVDEAMITEVYPR